MALTSSSITDFRYANVLRTPSRIILPSIEIFLHAGAGSSTPASSFRIALNSCRIVQALRRDALEVASSSSKFWSSLGSSAPPSKCSNEHFPSSLEAFLQYLFHKIPNFRFVACSRPGNVQSLDLVVGHEITKFLPGILYAWMKFQIRLVVFHRELERHLGPSSKFWINRKDRSSARIPNIPFGALFVVCRRRFGRRVLAADFPIFGSSPLWTPSAAFDMARKSPIQGRTIRTCSPA
jgi:hypothetical protein